MRRLPDDPKQFNELWNKLTPEEKDWLYPQGHNVGNHPGSRFFDGADHLGVRRLQLHSGLGLFVRCRR
ncbi:MULTISPECIES: hypothetical protein [Mycolicibacterium]|uniref:Uncharacterized protein n=1 Tax=Mycolicibacterium aubagnense TaxID=319707 RepID=A0ABM7IJI6_9MYCO|nr:MULTISPECIES: hypothetical protein [Mycolicibacterium]MCV7151354.1 hypothetical protein [Mycolicibacterium pyrenivorans]TLH66803.1 hypothetical protein C1S80_06980 [Mycolicibacterium aubagnense]WGI31607.1 hypothetical protein QDT91_20590 [Mycolicibacterium aubagnense]BBX86926.1 hypothetical protein MAUB_47990 [Mycolicibacterium aubagnense]